MMFFEIFENLKFLKFFDPQPQNFKNSPLVVEISADPQIWGVPVVTLGPRKPSETRGRIF